MKTTEIGYICNNDQNTLQFFTLNRYGTTGLHEEITLRRREEGVATNAPSYVLWKRGVASISPEVRTTFQMPLQAPPPFLSIFFHDMTVMARACCKCQRSFLM